MSALADLATGSALEFQIPMRGSEIQRTKMLIEAAGSFRSP